MLLMASFILLRYPRPYPITQAATAQAAINSQVFWKDGFLLYTLWAMANHASTRTTQLYDRRRDEVSLDEVERIVI